ncbi:LysR family transcriptional regulator [Bordetella genomosp. 10]|uniref:LysR family transcriptional regulator n=1 Tax=Bordetella genomosp. 10 TaxID=1416804 RepID=A0A261RZV2_9BORD|nr:LysR family transcriptional regulator [Bordetella genomosp. 10]OZI30619.1 LysR family transcriptional regulator [Bordetella genomosp. 10]
MSRHVSLRHLRCFVAVADTGSFTLAASRMSLTQSSLTSTIQQFEEAVGVRLFDRSTRRVALTQAGASFKAEAMRVIGQFDGAIGDLQALSDGRQGHVRIAAITSVVNYFLVDAIEGFRVAYPGITISLRGASAAAAEQMVANGEIDFAVESRYRGYDELSYTPLFEDRYGIVCQRDHPLARGSGPIGWESLESSSYIGFSSDTGIGAYLRAHAGKPALFDAPHDEVSNTSALYSMLGIGNRYSVLPALAASERDASKFVFRELRSPSLSREICLITRQLRALSSGSEHLLHFLCDTMRRKPIPPGVHLCTMMPDRRAIAASAVRVA